MLHTKKQLINRNLLIFYERVEEGEEEEALFILLTHLHERDREKRKEAFIRKKIERHENN